MNDRDDIHKTFFITNWKILPRKNHLIKGEKAYTVEPKVMQVLVCLAKNAPDPVSRAELFHEVWNGDYVSDDVLTRSVSILRKIFGDDPKKPAYIETIPKHGYALLIEPTFQKEEPAEDPEPEHSFASKKLLGYASIGAAILLVFLLGITLLNNTKLSVQETKKVPVTSMKGNEFAPSVSPNADKVVFMATSETEPTTEIYLTKFGDSSNPLRLTNNSLFEMSPIWSPDGQKIAFVRHTEDDSCGIFTMDQWGENQQQITKCNKRIYLKLDWSPDGEWIAFTHSESENSSDIPAIYLYSLKTAELKHLTNPSGDMFGDYSPRFSSDGRSLTFLRSIKEGVGALVTIDLQTGKEKTLIVDNYFRIRGYDWYEDQQSLILSANRAGGYGLWKYDITGKNFSTLLPGDNLFRPEVVQHGPKTQIIYEEWEIESNIYRLDLNSSGKERELSLITSSRMDSQPSISTKNGKLAFLSNRNGKREIWIANRDGSDIRSYQTDIELMPHTPVWSPSGEKLVFTGLKDGISQVFVADLYSTEIQQLTDGNADKINPSWSSDGSRVYYSKYESGQWNIYRKALTGGNEMLIVENNDAFFSRESADGQRLYYIVNLTNELYSYKLDSDSDPQKIPEITIDPDHRQDWRVTKDALYYLGLKDGKNILYRYVFETKQTEQVHTFNTSSLGMGLTINKEDEQIYFVKIDRSSSDLVMFESKSEL